MKIIMIKKYLQVYNLLANSETLALFSSRVAATNLYLYIVTTGAGPVMFWMRREETRTPQGGLGPPPPLRPAGWTVR